MKPAPDYVPAHGLLRGKSVLVTAAAGAGIGFAVAKRAAEEGCRALYISDVHERRLNDVIVEEVIEKPKAKKKPVNPETALDAE
jgi:3-oxoacyl-[acyl-carrier protein] reductase